MKLKKKKTGKRKQSEEGEKRKMGGWNKVKNRGREGGRRKKKREKEVWG